MGRGLDGRWVDDLVVCSVGWSVVWLDRLIHRLLGGLLAGVMVS